VKHLPLLLALCVVCGGLVLCTGCGGNEATKPVAPRAETAPPASAPSTETATPATAAPFQPVLTVKRTNDGVGLSVVNRGPGLLKLAQGVALERQEGERFVSVAGEALLLRRDCASQGCITLAPGGELFAPCWLESADGERCGELVRLPGAGTYRLVVRDCSGKASGHVTFVESRAP
jgi:hypothetical protein